MHDPYHFFRSGAAPSGRQLLCSTIMIRLVHPEMRPGRDVRISILSRLALAGRRRKGSGSATTYIFAIRCQPKSGTSGLRAAALRAESNPRLRSRFHLRLRSVCVPSPKLDPSIDPYTTSPHRYRYDGDGDPRAHAVTSGSDTPPPPLQRPDESDHM